MAYKNEVSSTGNRNYTHSRGSRKIGRMVGLILHKAGGDFLTTANLSDMKTNINAALQHATYSSRAFLIGKLGDPEDNGEGVTFESIAQFKYKTSDGTWDKIFIMTENHAAHIDLSYFAEGKVGRYLGIPVHEVEGGYTMKYKTTSTGIKGFNLHAFDVQPIEDGTSSTVEKSMVQIAFKNKEEISRAETIDITDVNNQRFEIFDESDGLFGVEQGYLTEPVTSPGNGIHVIALHGAGREENLIERYPTTSEAIKTDSFNVNLDDASSTAVTVSSVATYSVGGVVKYIQLTLDQLDYSNGDIALVTVDFAAFFTNTGRKIGAQPLRITLAK